jgi:hypothetical protein
MMSSPAGEGDCLIEKAGWAQKVADLIEGSAEAMSGVKLLEAAHRTIASLDPSVILFQHVVFVLISPMFHSFPEFLGDGRGIAGVAVGGDLLGLDLGDRPGRAEECLGRGQVAGFAALPCGSLR